MQITSRAEAKTAGLQHYFTGNPCSHGHVDQRRVANGSCAECERRAALAWRNRNIESARAAASKWHAENSEHRREWQDQWKSENPDRVKAYAKRCYQQNPAKPRAQQEAWRKSNPEKFRASRARYLDENRQRVYAHIRNRRARLKQAAGTHTAADIADLARKQDGKCVYCATAIGPRSWHVDHRRPIARGGSNDPSNLQLLCQPCNNRKWALDPEEFERRIGRRP